MAYNGMPQIPAVNQLPLAITASQFSSFATPAITVPFPSVYAGQTSIPYSWTSTATFAATRIPTTLGGVAATAGVHSINSAASAAGYRTHDYGNNGGGSGWPTWATAVIAACGGAAVVLLVVGLLCWRWRRKQRRAQGYTAGAAGGKRKRKVTAHQGGGAGGYTEKSTRERERQRQSLPALAIPPNISPTKSRSRSRQSGSGYDSPAGSYPPGPPSASPSRSRARDLAALGINRPSSASPSPYSQSRSRPSSAHPSSRSHPAEDHQPYRPASPSGPGGAYPAFAVPRSERNHHRDFSGSSDHGLLAAPAPGFAYAENNPEHGYNPRAGYETPPRRAPNTRWNDDSPSGPGSASATGSPAALLASPSPGRFGGRGEVDTPRSSLTVSTRGTGGAPYAWGWDGDEAAAQMPDAEAVRVALGRAMLGGDGGEGAGGYAPVGVALGGPEDDATWVGSHEGTLEASGYREREHERSTTPAYPPPGASAPSSSASHSQYTTHTSRAPSRQQVGRHAYHTHEAMPSGSLAPPIALGGEGGAPLGQSRSTTPLEDPPSSHGHGHGHGRGYSAGGNMSRASTYRTAEEEGDGESDGEEFPSRRYAR
ncbi:hypothetical protein JCM10207_009096 [Rhodosporidiobolus poonsookiae]